MQDYKEELIKMIQESTKGMDFKTREESQGLIKKIEPAVFDMSELLEASRRNKKERDLQGIEELYKKPKFEGFIGKLMLLIFILLGLVIVGSIVVGFIVPIGFTATYIILKLFFTSIPLWLFLIANGIFFCWLES